MTILHAWAIGIGVAGIALPLVIHWLTRPRPLRLPLSTLRFVLEAVHQRRARHRLRDTLILASRIAAVLLLAWAFARPIIGARPLVAANDAGDASRIVILDVSQSMAASERGIVTFERARAAAAGYLDYAPGLRANLVLAGARPQAIFEQPSSNFDVRNELSAAGVRPERIDVDAAIAQAAEMFARINPEGHSPEAARRRQLVIISDFQRSNWANVSFDKLPKDTQIQFKSVAPERTLANLAVLRVAAQGRAQEARGLRVEVDVGNYSATPRQVQVMVNLGQASQVLSGLCPPGVKTTLAGELTLREAGWQAGEARLSGVEDALSADDVRPFVTEVRSAPTYILVSRQSSKPQAVSSHFLERALTPMKWREEQKGERVVRVDPEALDRESLAAADVIVLDHPGKLPEQSINLLASVMRRGRAVLYIAAESIDAANLKLLSDAAGADLRMPVEFAPPQANQGQGRRDLFLLEMRKDQSPFVAFGESLSAAVGPLRFAGGLESRRMPGGLADDILATYSDQSACLVVAPCGSGAMAVLNADLGASNLPGSPMFVPLIGELVERLLLQRRGEQAVEAGQRLVAALPADAGVAAELSLHGPEASGSALGRVLDEGGSAVWTWNSAGPPGVYQVKRKKDEATVYAVACAIPPQESDLRPLEKTILTDRLAGGRNMHFAGLSEQQDRTDNAWTWILVACVGCMLLELIVLRAFKT